MEEKNSFDAHRHAFNLGHPSFSAFAWRLVRELPRGLLTWRRLCGYRCLPASALCLERWESSFCLLVYVLPPARQGVRCLILMLFHGLKRLAGRLVNLLFVMKNDIGSLFLLLENCLRDPDSPLLHDEGLHVGSERYARIVLTPLMMDFGYKSRTPRGAEDAKKWIRYDVPGDRPIVEQVVDLFRGIRDYVGTESSPALAERYPALGAKTRQVFEIYPFLGLNPANHTRERVRHLLEKYFGEYTGRWEDFRARLGNFDGHIERMGSHFFAGIKVSPPLGFDPWPEGNGDAMAKVELLDRLLAVDGEKLRSRILFGTDFAVNLMWMGSYNGYLGPFSSATALTPEEKHAFCSTNPKRFLFRQEELHRGTRWSSRPVARMGVACASPRAVVEATPCSRAPQ